MGQLPSNRALRVDLEGSKGPCSGANFAILVSDDFVHGPAGEPGRRGAFQGRVHALKVERPPFAQGGRSVF